MFRIVVISMYIHQYNSIYTNIYIYICYIDQYMGSQIYFDKQV